MRSKKSVNQVIELLTKKFLGRMGIIGITNERNNIIFYTNLNKIEYSKIPHNLYGYNIYIIPSGKFSIQV